MELHSNLAKSPRSDLSLSQRAIRGGVWVFALNITNRLLGLIRTIVLARVLAPGDFGVMGIALLTMFTLEIFSKMGFDIALIQKKEDTNAYLDTAWTIQVMRGILIFSILFVSAPLVGAFFDVPKAVAIVRVIAFAELFKGFASIGVIYFLKELEFNKQFLYQFSRIIADLAVAIPAALILRSVWALAFGLLSGLLVQLVVSYIIHPYRPKLEINRDKFRDLFSFGKWILSSSILIFIVTQGDDIFVGKLLGSAALGLYQMAFRISNISATEVTHVISQVTFPVYAKLQDNVPELRNAYLKVLQVTAFLSFPIGVLLLILAPDFTRLFLGEKWMPMVRAIQVLCIFGVIRSLAATCGPLFSGTNNPRFTTITSFIKLIFLAILIYPLTRKWGITGTALATTLPSLLVSQFYLVSRVAHILRCRLRDFAISIYPPVVGSILVLIFSCIIKRLSLSNVPTFAINFIAGIIIYTAFMFIFSRWYKEYNIIKVVANMIRNLR